MGVLIPKDVMLVDNSSILTVFDLREEKSKNGGLSSTLVLSLIFLLILFWFFKCKMALLCGWYKDADR